MVWTQRRSLKTSWRTGLTLTTYLKQVPTSGPVGRTIASNKANVDHESCGKDLVAEYSIIADAKARKVKVMTRLGFMARVEMKW